MIVFTMKSALPTAKAKDFYDFMVTANPEIYKHWLRDEHHEFHIVKKGVNSPIEDLIFFDQHISKKYRLKFHAITRVANRPNQVIFQMRKAGINLPGFLDLRFKDTENGLQLTEQIRIGYNGIGKVLDIFIKLVFNARFYDALSGHHRREWKALEEIFAKRK